MLQPKKVNSLVKSKGLSPEQQSEVESDLLFTNNWNANRIVNGKKLPKGYQISPRQPVILSDLNKDKQKGESIDRGLYEPDTGIIRLDPSFQEEYGIPAHEYTHRFQDKTKQMRPNIYQDYIKNPIESLVPNTETYQTDPIEIHSELMRLRRNANFKPEQVITPEDIQNVDFNNYNFNSIENKDTLLKLLNSTAYNDNNKINIAAYGGKLNMNMKINYAQGGQLTRFDEGGTHEQNPLGGIPQGQSSDGSMNTVEQGETKNDDYIYSNRISLDKDLVKQFNLPAYVANKSVSDASKAIDNKFKDRFDKYSTETKNTLLNRLTEAQEFVKQQDQAKQDQINQSLQANSQEVPDMMNGEIPSGMEEFADSNQQVQPQQIPVESQPIAAYGGYQKKFFAGGYTNNEITLPTSDAQVEAAKNDGNTINPNLQKYTSAYNSIAPTIANSINVAGNDNQRSQTLQSINTLGNSAGSLIGGKTGGLVGNIVTGTTGLYEMGDEAFGKSNIDVSGNQSVSGANVGKSVGSGALKGAGTGAAIGSIIPGVGTAIGAGVGALVGGVTGFIGGKKDKKAQELNNSLYSKKYNKQFSDTYSYGGKLNMGFETKYANGGKLPRPKPNALYPNISNNYDINSDIVLPNNIQSSDIPVQSKAQFEQYANLNANVKPTLNDKFNSLKKKVDPYLDKINENYGEALRYAPIAMNAYQLSKLKKPSGVQYNTLDNRYKPTYIDEARMQNTIDQEANNQINAISQLGGSEGATRNAILAAGLNKTKALSGAYANSVIQNASENQTAQQFNLGVDSTNVGIRNKAIDEMRADQGNYDTQKSKLLSSIGTDIGSIGREVSDKKQIADLLGYTWNGKYIVNKDGKPIPSEQIQKEIAATKSQSAYGGKLNLKYK